MSLHERSGPIALRMLLGTRLRRHREAAGVGRDEAAHLIRASESKISRMELGRVGFKKRDVEDLLTLYGVADPGERSTLLSLARKAKKPGWWQEYSDVMLPWFEEYVGLESAASVIRTYEVQFVPGLLQTEEYARAVVSRGYRDSGSEEIERRVQFRMARSEMLAKPGAPKLWAVVDEAALRRPIGGVEVQRRQIEALVAAVQQSNIVLQVMPFGVGGHSAEGGAFTLLRFPEADIPDIVYVEQLIGAWYLYKPKEISTYRTTAEHLGAESPPPSHTPEILSRIHRQLSG